METALGQKNVEKKGKYLKHTWAVNSQFCETPQSGHFQILGHTATAHLHTVKHEMEPKPFQISGNTQNPQSWEKKLFTTSHAHILGGFSLPSSWWFFWTGEGFRSAARTCKPPMEGPAAGVKPEAPVFAPTFNLLKAKPGLLSFPSRELSPLPHYPAPGEPFWSASSVCEGGAVVDLKKSGKSTVGLVVPQPLRDGQRATVRQLHTQASLTSKPQQITFPCLIVREHLQYYHIII